MPTGARARRPTVFPTGGFDGTFLSNSLGFLSMLTAMREILKPVLDCVLTLKTQLRAAISIPLADASQLGDPENAVIDGTVSWDVQRPDGQLFDCVGEHPGRMTRNGRGSLEIGAARDN